MLRDQTLLSVFIRNTASVFVSQKDSMDTGEEMDKRVIVLSVHAWFVCIHQGHQFN